MIEADLFKLDLKETFDIAIIAGYGDFHLLQSLQDVEKAFISLHKHLKQNGCLALELILPPKESCNYPKRTFYPRAPNYTDKKVWKENEGNYVADVKKQYIYQTIYIEDEKGIESFEQSTCLQYYDRNEIITLLNKCGFSIKNEYKNRNKNPWKQGDDTWIVEAIIID